MYAGKTIAVFLNTCKISLAELKRVGSRQMQCTIFGFNGLPTMINRSMLEVSVLKPEDIPHLKNLCEQLKTEYVLVDDRVGLVTPRIICMIIKSYCKIDASPSPHGKGLCLPCLPDGQAAGKGRVVILADEPFNIVSRTTRIKNMFYLYFFLAGLLLSFSYFPISNHVT